MRPGFAIPIPAERRNVARANKALILNRDRSRPHFTRKFYHMLMGMVCFGIYAFLADRTQALLLLGIVGGPLFVFDVVRFRVASVNQMALSLFGPIMRREELKSLSGNSFFVLGLIVITFFFPKPIVLLSVLYLAIGDPLAAVVGTLWGKHKLGKLKKSWEGLLANWAGCFFATFLFSRFFLGLPAERAFIFALIGGTVGAVAETLPAPIDDNFTIPVASALMLQLITLAYPF